MSIPTLEPLPRLTHPKSVGEWANRLVDALQTHLSKFILLSHRARLVIGGNSNINIDYAGMFHVIGPTGAFNISGFAGGSDGRILIVRNNTTQVMTLQNENANSSVNNRITTLTGGNVTGDIAHLIYDGQGHRWIVVSVR